MEYNTHRTPNHNGHNTETMAVGVRVASRYNNTGYGTETTYQTNNRHHHGDNILSGGTNIRAKRILCLHGRLDYDGGTIRQHQETGQRHRNNNRRPRINVDREIIERRDNGMEIYNCRRCPVGIATNRGQFEPLGAEWRHISTKHARHTGMVETMSRPLSFVADTTSATERENRKQTVRGHPVGLSGNIPTPDTKIIFASHIS